MNNSKKTQKSLSPGAKVKQKNIPLWNTLGKKDLIENLKNQNTSFVVVSFYCYTDIKNPSFFRDYLFFNWSKLDILGRIYVAFEGINAQIAIPVHHFEHFKKEIDQISFLRDVRLNLAFDDGGVSHAFLKLKIKVRKKIVADGLNDDAFDVKNTGIHLSAETFNHMTQDPNTILIDMRNHYESEVGHFKGAITPDVNTFRESLPLIEDQYLKGNEDKPIVMYCTGGIRCEKASAWFKHRGYRYVHQLEGGIIKYANDCKKFGLPNQFIGKNFVFDERLGERISQDIIAKCHQCGSPCDTHTNCLNDACNLLFIQCASCKEKFDQCCSFNCQKSIHSSPQTQKASRKKAPFSHKIYSRKNLRDSADT